MDITGLVKTFQSLFFQQPTVVRSPGRINVIGEHTDYNEGFVLPAAVDKAVYVAVSKRNDNSIVLHSSEFKDEFEANLDRLQSTAKRWPNYILGVVDQLQKKGFSLAGFNLVVDGDVPIGAGLSSSAAVECATAMALNEINRLNISKIDLVKIAQKAEHEFAGVMCGIMDQFASTFGKKDFLIKLDCRSLQHEYIPFGVNDVKIVLFDSGIKHSLAVSAYNERKQECEEGVRLISKKHPEVKSLRDASITMIDQCIDKASALYKRCRYVVEENSRLLTACQNLQDGNISALGKKMLLTHDGLSKQYEVSCDELDFLVDQVRNIPAVLGARMMGGGFGGCTINLVQEQFLDRVVNEVSMAFERNFGIHLKVYEVRIDDGTSVLKS